MPHMLSQPTQPPGPESIIFPNLPNALVDLHSAKARRISKFSNISL